MPTVRIAAFILVTALSLAGSPRVAQFAQPSPTASVGIAYLPIALRSGLHGTAPYPDPALAARIWRAVDAFTAAHPAAAFYPGYGPGVGGPSSANARRNVQAACHDFPDLPADFGAGAHHRACYEWVADYLGLYHAARARQLQAGQVVGQDPATDLAWAGAYLDAAVEYLSMMVYGPEDAPGGEGYRDTVAAVWQNPLRAVNVAIIADILHQAGALDPVLESSTQEVLSGVARAWYTEVWQAGLQPSTGARLTTLTAAVHPAYSLAGHQVVTTVPIRIPWGDQPWNADKGSSPSEEVAWMGAGVMLAAQVIRPRLPAGEADELYQAARHFASYAVVFDRPDPRTGRVIRTLNSETTGGAYGQRKYWIENHTADVPSIPYVGWTWHYLDAALLASDRGGQRPWDELVPDEAQWQVLQASAEETLKAADGTWLVDFTPGKGVGFNVARFPVWTMPCGQYRLGSHYVEYDGRAGGPSLYVSEIGHPAGLDLIAASWPLMRIAIQRGDGAAYYRWRNERLLRVLDEYTAHPPDPAWATCGIAPYVSHNPGYHWARMLSMVVMAYLGASGYEARGWAGN